LIIKNRNIVLTALILIFSIILFNWIDIDIRLQDYFYNSELKQWIIDRNDPILEFIFYNGIKKIFILFAVILLITVLFFRKIQIIHDYKQGLLIVLFSVLLVPLIVSGLKAITNTPCPKNIRRYNGNYPYVTVLRKYPKGFQQHGKIKCFPAGHASGGFALLSLFFLFKRKNNRIIAFISAMVIAWNIGLYKMLIGDHFLSHTIVTMILAWLLILIIAKGVYSYYSLSP
jgi:membrane-associated PAP2 superfamily phosphatase